MNSESFRGSCTLIVCVFGALAGSLIPSSALCQYAGAGEHKVDATFGEIDRGMSDRSFLEKLKGFMGVVHDDRELGDEQRPCRLGDWNQCDIPEEFRSETELLLEDHHKMWTASQVTAINVIGRRPRLHPYEFKILYYRALADLDIYVATYRPNDASGAKRLRFDVTNLTNTPEVNELHPCWSPNGQFVAFSVLPDDSDKDDTGGIYVMKADGTDRTRITDVDGKYLAWSPDGSRIAFSRITRRDEEDYFRGPGATYDLFVVDVNGGSVRQLTDTLMSSELRPSWHPYEDIITYERWEEPYRPTGSVEADTGLPIYRESGRTQGRVWIVLAEFWHGQVTPDFPHWHTGDFQVDGNPIFTPSGQQIIFRSNRLGNGSEILRIPTEGGPMEAVGQVGVQPGKHWNGGDFHVNWRFTDYGAGCGGFESVDTAPGDSFSRQIQGDK